MKPVSKVLGGIIVAVTISDIAKTAKVSQATVSRVLNDSGYVKDETREKVLKVMKDLNYSPSAIARSLTTKKTNIIGVIVPDIKNPFFGDAIKGISKMADQHNFNIILCDADENIEKEIKAIKLLKEQRIEGIIITPTSVENEFNSKYLAAIENLGIPVILLEGHVKYSNFSGVFIDNVDGAFKGTEALIKNGHTKIAIITGRMNSQSAKDRLVGYKKALAINNIPLKEDYIFYGDYTTESGYELTCKMLSMKDKPTAVFVSSNMMTIGCIKKIFEQKLSIPRDIAVMGYDDLDMLNLFGVNISYVSVPTIELGKKSMKMLLEELNQESRQTREIKRVILDADVVLKGSEKM
ncbi:LacI family transcriptional regulator [Clostridium botulinum C/D]|nr:LacI family DNA-binding transcriptional regulator [Clostridium botulinum]AEB75347.1 Transcriptional regulator [Clostridium botulinum BKT015925]MCD3197062.1 LacI family transcriptional regulator [Clostridium botulinum C/D]MCD3203469.1 LacI family transcriptional regulator [Clostridium botulinum C/D]MCD3210531.1 LacI family transcriptional regulator [Clostridium botulinum C/D]MCD3213892.1 LacI family transcriptional regulator [Clostridium botulinum C/D]